MKNCCTGKCCATFSLNIRHEELSKFKVDPSSAETRLVHEFILKEDVPKILNMLIPLPHKGDQQYTCKHYKDNKCSVYENRPNMCKMHGERYPCHVKDCKLKK